MESLDDLAKEKLFPELENNNIRIEKMEKEIIKLYFVVPHYKITRGKKNIDLYLIDRKYIYENNLIESLKKTFDKIKDSKIETKLILTNSPNKVMEIRNESGNNNIHIVGFSLTAGYEIAKNYIQKLLNR